jgi:tripartite-type tricarboxylate transporter receptor subunit TctC
MESSPVDFWEEIRMAVFKTTRRAGLALGISLLASAAFGMPALAQSFPDRPVTLVIPFAAGGSTDVVGRIIAQKMSDELGQQVVVQNVGGAGGSLGAANVARAEPDGYTILMATVATHALNPLILKTKPYDAEKDFAPISLLVLVPNVLVVNPELPVKTVEELVALLKANPDKYSYASSGNGTPLHLSGELFKSMAGVSLQHVPYKGSGPALNDVIGNQVPIMFDNLPSSSGHITAGTLRALAVTTAKRAPSFPDVPTMAESGVPGYETYTWNALFAPAGTPPEIVARLNTAANNAMKDPTVMERMKEFSATIVGSTPEELATHVKAELAKWTPVVKDANVSMD